MFSTSVVISGIQSPTQMLSSLGQSCKVDHDCFSLTANEAESGLPKAFHLVSFDGRGKIQTEDF